MTSLAITAVYFGAIGLAALRFCGEQRSEDRLAHFATSYLLGAAVTGLGLFIAGVAGLPLNRLLLTMPLVVSLPLCFSRRPTAAFPKSETRYPLVPTLLMVSAAAILLVEAAVVPLHDYDGRTFWTLKAKAIAHEQSITGEFFQGRGARNLHSHYPLLLPLDGAVLISFRKELDDRHTRWLYVLISISFLFVVRGSLTEVTSPAMAAWCAAVLSLLPQFLVVTDGGGASCYADVPFAAFVTLAVRDLWRIQAFRRFPRTFGVWTTALLLTKNEGASMAVILLLVAALLSFRKHLVRKFFPHAGLVATFAALLSFWRGLVPLEYDEDYARLLRRLPERLGNAPRAGVELLQYTLDIERWGFFWVAVGTAIIFNLARRSRPQVLPILAVISGQLLSYVCVFAVTEWNLADLARVSSNRLLFHLVGPGLYLIAIAIGKVPLEASVQGSMVRHPEERFCDEGSQNAKMSNQQRRISRFFSEPVLSERSEPKGSG